MASRNKAAMVLALAAGALLLAAGVSGLASWEAIRDFVTAYVIDNPMVQMVFAALVFIASLGGISVMAGGVLIGRGNARTGKLVIGLGAGMGMIGMMVSLAVAIYTGSFSFGGFFTTVTIGVILSIGARSIAK
jgi:hypothetical protein